MILFVTVFLSPLFMKTYETKGAENSICVDQCAFFTRIKIGSTSCFKCKFNEKSIKPISENVNIVNCKKYRQTPESIIRQMGRM